MGIRSQGGASNGENYVPAIFRDIFGRTGIDAVAPSAPALGINASGGVISCLLYTSPSPRDRTRSRMPSSA